MGAVLYARDQGRESSTMNVAIVVGIAFAGFIFSCVRGRGKLKDPEELLQQRPRTAAKEQTPADHHAAA